MFFLHKELLPYQLNTDKIRCYFWAFNVGKGNYRNALIWEEVVWVPNKRATQAATKFRKFPRSYSIQIVGFGGVLPRIWNYFFSGFRDILVGEGQIKTWTFGSTLSSKRHRDSGRSRNACRSITVSQGWLRHFSRVHTTGDA